MDSAPFRLLQSHVLALTTDLEIKSTLAERVGAEADELREMQETFRVTVGVSW